MVNMWRSRFIKSSSAVVVRALVIVSALIIFTNGPVVAKSKTPKPTKPAKKATKPVTTKKGSTPKASVAVWRGCVIHARMARFNDFKMRKLEVWARKQDYIHVSQKAQCSGPGPVPQMREFEPAEVGGGVYVSAFSHSKNDEGEEGTTSYYKTSTASGYSATNPDLTVDSVAFGSDENGIWASLSYDSRVRGTEKSFGQHFVTSFDAAAGQSVRKMEPYSFDEGASWVLDLLSEKIRYDVGAKGVDGFAFNGEFRPSVTPLPAVEGGQAFQGDFFTASNVIQDNGYVLVGLNRQYSSINNSDAISTLEVHFAAWIETSGSLEPKNLPPLVPPADRDPAAPLGPPPA
jgi:hypothetical protein